MKFQLQRLIASSVHLTAQLGTQAAMLTVIDTNLSAHVATDIELNITCLLALADNNGLSCAMFVSRNSHSVAV